MSISADSANVSRRRRSIVRERKGAMLVFIAVTGVVLMGFLAMTLDIGAGSRERRIAQTAADAAAIGGGQEIMRNRLDLVTGSATSEAAANGFVSGGGTTITINNGPLSGPYTGNNQYVEVIIAKPIPTIFGSVLGLTSLNIQARAVAGVSSYGLNCVFSLDPNAAGGIEIENGADLVTNCGVVINSDNAAALDLNSSGDLTAAPSPVTIRGGYSAGGGASVTPTPQTGGAGVENPLKNITMPTVGACDYTGTFVVSGTMTLNPGVYCGGISITNSSSTANLNPGTYIMAGGGLTVTNSGVINGTGVTLINTTGSTPFKPFEFGNGCKAKLSAPTSGDFKGILMFQDPAAPTPPPNNVFACASTSNPELQGALYFPNSTIEFGGSDTNTQIMGSVIANKVVIGGKISIINDTTSGNVLKRLSLVQ